jgi:uncharacterized membrane protein
MKKDLTNVVITFSLIISMVLGGSFVYGKKILADAIMAQIAEDRLVRQQQELAIKAQVRERERDAAQAAENDRIAKEEALAQEKIKITQAKNQSTKDQAAYQAELKARQEAVNKSNAEAAALAQQQADAKIEAQRLADQRVVDAQVKKKASRKSRAS